jgi:SAM-dependent methyltransferase
VVADTERISARLARYYDLDLLDDPGDLDLYLAMADRTDGPVLELAAGSGRLAVPLALAGHQVTAVDNDPQMLARAGRAWAASRPAGRGKAAKGSLDCVEADLTRLSLDARYGLAFIGLNSLLLLDGPDAQRRAMQVLATHLRLGGVAIVDVLLPDAAELAAYDGRLTLDWIREDDETGETVTKLSSARHDAASATVTLTTLYDTVAANGGPLERTRRVDQLTLRSVSELVRDASDAGLEVELLAGDHQANPFGPGSERIVLIAVSV